MIENVLRGHLGQTPKRIAGLLGVPCVRDAAVDYRTSLLFHYPKELIGASASYPVLRKFYNGTKFEQRQGLISAGLPVPESYGDAESFAAVQCPPETRWVVRPMHHSRGKNFFVVDTQSALDLLKANPGAMYVSRLFPKVAEYRVVFVHGKAALFCHKVPAIQGANLPPVDQPWNMSNGTRFARRASISSTKLANKRFLRTMQQSTVLIAAHIVGVDVMVDADGLWTVCEFNFCPTLLGGNAVRVADAVRAYHGMAAIGVTA